MFPRLEMVHPNDSVRPTPNPSIANVPAIISTVYKKVNANTVERMEGEITCLFTRTGSTALGCMMCLNSFLETLASITRRMLFIPRRQRQMCIRDRAQAPIIIITVSMPHVIAGHVI